MGKMKNVRVFSKICKTNDLLLSLRMPTFAVVRKNVKVRKSEIFKKIQRIREFL